MRSRVWFVVASLAFALGGVSPDSLAKDPPKKDKVREGSYYEFRGHLYDRSTIAQTFTLYWSEGSQPINVSSDTKIYRKGVLAPLASVKSGDAVCGIGVVRKGKLIAVAVAFGDDGVELPDKAKPPGVSLLQLAPISHGGR